MRGKKTTNLKRSLKLYFKKPSLIALLLVIFFCGQYYIDNNPKLQELYNNEIRVIDGDSLAFGVLSIRLQGIDAPELKQECRDNRSNQLYKCGQMAKDYLISLIDQQPVKCSNEGVDRYQRQLAYCYIGKLNLNSEMVRSGNALAYTKYDKSFIKEEMEAKANKVGIWAGKFDDPENWRKNKKNLRK